MRAIIAISQRADEQPMLISFVMEAALHSYVPRVVTAVLALSEPQPKELLKAQSAISHLLSLPTLQSHVRGEQALLEDLVRSFSEGLIDRQKLDAMDPTVPADVTGFDFIDERLHRMRRRGWLLRDSTFQLRYYQAWMRVLRESADWPTSRETELYEMLDGRRREPPTRFKARRLWWKRIGVAARCCNAASWRLRPNDSVGIAAIGLIDRGTHADISFKRSNRSVRPQAASLSIGRRRGGRLFRWRGQSR